MMSSLTTDYEYVVGILLPPYRPGYIHGFNFRPIFTYDDCAILLSDLADRITADPDDIVIGRLRKGVIPEKSSNAADLAWHYITKGPTLSLDALRTVGHLVKDDLTSQ
jgi:hypothetical protein